MSRERKDWVDLAKGVAIMLMTLGHSGYPEIISKLIGVPHLVRNWIYAFHMPLFFLLSGAPTVYLLTFYQIVQM